MVQKIVDAFYQSREAQKKSKKKEPSGGVFD